MARRNFHLAGLAHKIELLEGPALTSLASLAGRTFDLVFIDADKQSYPEYLEWALKLTAQGSTIVTDNVWRGGSVAMPTTGDGGDRAVFQFNREVARHPRLFSAIVPRLDGSDAACVSYVRS
jgi:predicted O-methyltransferase YrrM